MAYAVEWTPRALKALRRLSRDLQARAVAEAAALAINPRPPGSKPLKGKPTGRWSLRFADDWRLIYTIHDAARLVLVIDVANRGKVYRKR